MELWGGGGGGGSSTGALPKVSYGPRNRVNYQFDNGFQDLFGFLLEDDGVLTGHSRIFAFLGFSNVLRREVFHNERKAGKQLKACVFSGVSYWGGRGAC